MKQEPTNFLIMELMAFCVTKSGFYTKWAGAGSAHTHSTYFPFFLSSLFRFVKYFHPGGCQSTAHVYLNCDSALPVSDC